VGYLPSIAKTRRGEETETAENRQQSDHAQRVPRVRATRRQGGGVRTHARHSTIHSNEYQKSQTVQVPSLDYRRGDRESWRV
jgi:hypothetical protein